MDLPISNKSLNQNIVSHTEVWSWTRDGSHQEESGSTEIFLASDRDIRNVGKTNLGIWTNPNTESEGMAQEFLKKQHLVEKDFSWTVSPEKTYSVLSLSKK